MPRSIASPVTLIAVAACLACEARPAPDPPARPQPEPQPWTIGIIDRPRPGTFPATMNDVRQAAHPGFDRVTFQFAERVPGYHIEYVDRPIRQCGSGEPVPIAGDGWLRVRFEPAYAHDERGRPSVVDRERAPGLPNLVELELTCDFEAQVEWVLGLRSPNPYRAFELADPPRLVVDVQH